MKNKGRIHLSRSANCKSTIHWLTRPAESMASRKSNHLRLGKFSKRKWQKRMRGYLKTQKYKDLLGII